MAGKRKKTHEQFITEIFDLVGQEYSVIGEYKTSKDKIKLKHNKCGYEYEVYPQGFFKGSRCVECFLNKRRHTQEQFVKKVSNLVGNEYSVRGQYKNADTKIRMKHNECGNEWEIAPYSFLGGKRRCPNCNGTPLKTTYQFKEDVFNLVGDEYMVLGEYITAQIKIKMKHNKCASEYMVKPNNFISGYRCPACKLSKGEVVISKWLEGNNLDYKLQYRFEDCRHKKTLPFDFAVFHNNKLVTLIEYDGLQHYSPVDLFGGEDAFKLQQLKDLIKTNYCKKNNFPLLRIPYWNLDEIDYLLNMNLQHLLATT